MPEEILKKFAVSYEIDYVHRVVVGVQALDAESAQQLAEKAFNDGAIWDDTESMPLLFDDYEEIEGETLRFNTEEISELPSPDSSVIAIKQKEAAFNASRMLLNGEIDFARDWARKAIPIQSGQDQEELCLPVDQGHCPDLLGQEPDLEKLVMDDLDLTWGDVKELVEKEAKMAFQLNLQMSENVFDTGSWQRKWFLDKYLALQLERDCLSNIECTQENPIALITLSGGVLKETGEEGGVDVEVFDFDDYRDSPEDFKASLPSRFKALAGRLGISSDVVAQADQEFECKKCGRVYEDSKECMSDDCPKNVELMTSSEIFVAARKQNIKFWLLQNGNCLGPYYLTVGYNDIFFFKGPDKTGRENEVCELKFDDFFYLFPDSLGKVWRIDQMMLTHIGDEAFTNNRLWKLRDALEQVRAALPDVSFAKQERINPDLIERINSVLNSPDNLDEFKRVLMEVKNALPQAWANHGGVAAELLQLIDLAIRM